MKLYQNSIPLQVTRHVVGTNDRSGYPHEPMKAFRARR